MSFECVQIDRFCIVIAVHSSEINSELQLPYNISLSSTYRYPHQPPGQPSTIATGMYDITVQND